MLGAAPLESRPDLPRSVIRYVARTGETILLDEYAADGPFGRDAGFAGAAPFSSLAAPIGYKGRLTGIVYLENDLTRSAFGSDRMRECSFAHAHSLQQECSAGPIEPVALLYRGMSFHRIASCTDGRLSVMTDAIPIKQNLHSVAAALHCSKSQKLNCIPSLKQSANAVPVTQLFKLFRNTP